MHCIRYTSLILIGFLLNGCSLFLTPEKETVYVNKYILTEPPAEYRTTGQEPVKPDLDQLSTLDPISLLEAYVKLWSDYYLYYQDDVATNASFEEWISLQKEAHKNAELE